MNKEEIGSSPTKSGHAPSRLSTAALTDKLAAPTMSSFLVRAFSMKSTILPTIKLCPLAKRLTMSLKKSRKKQT